MELLYFILSLFFFVLQFSIVIATQKTLQNFWDSNLHKPPKCWLWARRENLELGWKQRFKYLKKSQRYPLLLIIMVSVHSFLMSLWFGEERKGRNKEEKVGSFWASALKSVLSTCFQTQKFYFCYATLIFICFL